MYRRWLRHRSFFVSGYGLLFIKKAPSITLVDLENEDLEYITPYECQGEDDVFVSRVREDISVENGLNFWCVSDNLRKGAALNTV